MSIPLKKNSSLPTFSANDSRERTTIFSQQPITTQQGHNRLAIHENSFAQLTNGSSRPLSSRSSLSQEAISVLGMLEKKSDEHHWHLAQQLASGVSEGVMYELLQALQNSQEAVDTYRRICRRRFPEERLFYSKDASALLAEKQAKAATESSTSNEGVIIAPPEKKTKTPKGIDTGKVNHVLTVNATAKTSSADDPPSANRPSSPSEHETPSSAQSSTLEFLREFESQLLSRDLPIEEHWERLLPLCLNEHKQKWFYANVANKDLSWKDVCKSMCDHLDTSIHHHRLYAQVIRLRQRDDESLVDYIERFQKKRREANCESDKALVSVFLSSLRDEYVEPAYLVVSDNFGKEIPSDIDIVCNLITAPAPPITPVDSAPLTVPVTSAMPTTPAMSPTPTAPAAPHIQAPLTPKTSGDKRAYPSTDENAPSDEEKENTRKRRDSGKQDEKWSCSPQKSKPERQHRMLCRYCGTPWFTGHRCNEYYEIRSREKHSDRTVRYDDSRVDDRPGRSPPYHSKYSYYPSNWAPSN